MNLLILSIIVIIIIFLLYLRYLVLFFLIPAKIKKARKLLNIKKEDTAIHCLNNVLKMDKGNALANWLLAEIYRRKSQYVLAQMYLYDILHFGKFTKKVNEIEIRETLAYLYQKLGDFNKALVQYILLKNENKLTEGGVKRAIRIGIEGNNYKQAESLIKLAESLDMDDGEIDYFKALIHFHQSSLPAVERSLKNAVEKGYRNYEVDYLLGKVYFFSRKYKLALNHFEKLPINYLNTVELESFIGQCFFYLKDYNATITMLEKFLKDIDKKKNKFFANIEYMLACAYESMGDIEKALKIWKNIDSYTDFFGPAKEKLDFYKNVANIADLRDIILLKTPLFIDEVKKVIESMGFVVKKALLEDEKNLEYLCSSARSERFFNMYFIFITRRTQKIDTSLLNEILIRARQSRARSVLIIAPSYEEDALHFAERNTITAYTFEVFLKKESKGDGTK